MTDLERIGGVERLSVLMTRFLERMAGDFVIGFRFEGKDLQRIAFHETELAAAHLDVSLEPARRVAPPKSPRYSGRSLPAVHGPLRLTRGQFNRRLSVLATVLRENAVPEDVITRWLEHDRSLEPAIATSDDCVVPVYTSEEMK